MVRNQIADSERRDYFSFLLRVWRVEVKERTLWRASLESPNTGERLGFADLEALSRYLRAETGQEGSETCRMDPGG